MADHELSAKDAIFEAHFAVKMGEVIVTGNVLPLRLNEKVSTFM